MQIEPTLPGVEGNAMTAEALLSSKRFELLVHSIKDYAIYLLDLEGRIVSWNSGARHLKGYTAEEIMGRHFSCLHTDEDRGAGVPGRALAAAAELGRYEAEGRRVRKDGSRFWASIVIHPVFDENEALIGYAVVTHDLTDKKAAEQALFESEQRFRLLVQGVRDYAIYMLDPDGYVTDWNAGAALIKGYATHEIVGRHFSCFYTPEDRERGEPERGLALALEHNTFQNEGWRVRKNGSRFWASIVIDPIYSETGKLIGFAKITRDVTERKRAQEELDHQREVLSHAQKLEAIGRITGGVAHDFNNLLTVIRSAADLLSMASLSTQKRVQYTEIIAETTTRAAQLTQQLLAFAREQPLHPEAFDIASRIRGLMHVIEMSVGSNVKVDTEFPGDLRLVHADAGQFETAVLNLIINARDAMQSGGSLHIGACNAVGLPGLSGHASDIADFVAVTITDTGCGIQPSVIKQIFEPFFTTKELNKGTGLGLSQVYGFAKQSGGEVIVESEVGSGTRFTLYLPCAKSGDAPSSSDTPPIEQKKIQSSKILLVEDNEIVGEPDAVMPGINGIELGREIRRRRPDPIYG